MSDGEQERLLFLHIPKTAGSTMRSILAEQYPAAETIHLRGSPARSAMIDATNRGELRHINPHRDTNRKYRAELERLPADEVRRARLVVGHLAYGLHEFLPGPYRYLTVLRDPVERTLSLYYVRVRQHGLTASLDDWVRSGNDPSADNAQAFRVAGPDAATDPAADVLAVARAHLADPQMVFGLAERFDESLLVISRALGWRRVGYASRNVGRRPPRAAIDASTIAEIERRNAADLDLYELASRLFAERFAALELPPSTIDAEIRAFNRYPMIRRVRGAVRRAAQSLAPRAR